MQTDVTKLREFCKEWGYYYYQTRDSLDFQNLLDDDFKGVYCIHAQGRINTEVTDSTGFIVSKEYTGRLYFCIPSNLDGIIDGDKYDKYIYPLDQLNIHDQLVKYLCKESIVKITNIQPFYNLFSINYDGLSMDYEIEIDGASELTEEEKRFFITNGKLKC